MPTCFPSTSLRLYPDRLPDKLSYPPCLILPMPQFADAVKWAVARRIALILQNKNVKFEECKATIICTILDPDDKNNIFKGKNYNGIWNVLICSERMRKCV